MIIISTQNVCSKLQFACQKICQKNCGIMDKYNGFSGQTMEYNMYIIVCIICIMQPFLTYKRSEKCLRPF